MWLAALITQPVAKNREKRQLRHVFLVEHLSPKPPSVFGETQEPITLCMSKFVSRLHRSVQKPKNNPPEPTLTKACSGLAL